MSIVLDGISKVYGSNSVLSGVTLEIEDGELFVLLGASGSGKSTLLRIIAGLTPADKGTLRLHGHDVTHVPTQARNVGFVFQNYALFRHMTVADNIEFGMAVRGVPHAARAARRDEMLELVGLAGMGGRYPRQLSGGQQQRVAVARALAHEPSLLLLDEPFGALDVKIRAQLRQTLRRIQRQLGVTTILVTHDQEEAFELADRIGVIDHGQLLEVGTPVELYNRPRHPFVAGFVGSATMLAARWEEGEVVLGALRLPAPTPPEDLPPSGRVALLLRPEDIALLPVECNGHGERLPLLGTGIVEESYFLGTLQRIQVRLDPLPGIRSLRPDYGEERIPMQVARLTGRREEHLLEPGERVQVRIRNFHLLARGTPPLLVCVDETASDEYLRLVENTLGRVTEGPLTVLLIGTSTRALPGLQTRVAPILNAIPGATVRTRVGNSAKEILRELQARHYDTVVVNGAGAGADPVARELVSRSPVPVLVMKGHRDALRRLLLCTAAGEPGKIDVLVGGRLAQQSGAAATLLHVMAPNREQVFVFEQREGPPPHSNGRGPIERHLEQGRQTLLQQGVRTETRMRRGGIVEEILAEAREGDYDLLVVGGHMPGATPARLAPDLAGQVVQLADRPVLVVRDAA